MALTCQNGRLYFAATVALFCRDSGSASPRFPTRAKIIFKIILTSILIAGVIFSTGCFSEEIGHQSTDESDEIIQTTSENTGNQDETSEDINKPTSDFSIDISAKESQITQPITTDVSEIVRSAHKREGLDPLYQAAFPERLELPLVSYQVIDPQALIEALPGNFNLMNNQTRIYQDEEGGILGSNNDYSLNYRHPRCDSQLNTVYLQNAYSLANRRIKTFSVSDEFSFMSRQSAVDYSQNLFQSLGYSNLILRSIYSVYDVETGEEFYFIQWMQGFHSVPVLDDSSLWIMEQDQSGAHCMLECIIDRQGLSYLRANSKLNLIESKEAIPIVSKEEAVNLVNEKADQVLLPDVTRSVDSVELVWSSTEFRPPSDSDAFFLEPFYLVVVREDSDDPDSELYQMGPSFIQYFVDAGTGAIQ